MTGAREDQGLGQHVEAREQPHARLPHRCALRRVVAADDLQVEAAAQHARSAADDHDLRFLRRAVQAGIECPRHRQRQRIRFAIVEADETFFLTSAKGSRKLVRRAPRKRGGKAKRPGLSEEQIPVLIVRDRHGATLDAKLPDLQGDTIKSFLRPVVARYALLVSDGAKAYGSFAKEIGIEHRAVVASQGVHVVDGIHHIQNVNAYMSRLKGWMALFNGVASKYLTSYLGWRRLIEREGQGLSRSVTWPAPADRPLHQN